jgi:hypothetical protein
LLVNQAAGKTHGIFKEFAPPALNAGTPGTMLQWQRHRGAGEMLSMRALRTVLSLLILGGTLAGCIIYDEGPRYRPYGYYAPPSYGYYGYYHRCYRCW